ncbi:DUF2226 domain-containing protein [Thermococcus sp. MAR1]|uniref:DUF2226 domain-containing protein n=1 Tax=Thermococcus sp. MAR1 TaxID=1638263 RepID=UPI001439B800|nr:DUF2226 domain-containing protein [Thermococcus sp. MAR1]NJE09903.1 DUF2226 domain-containing protein [Thermococcus sp. MAR1]
MSMLPGRFEEVIDFAGFEDISDVIKNIKEGYLKFSWRENDTIKTGYLLVIRGRVVGALLEDVLTGEALKGEDALKKISEVLSYKDKVKLVEIYKFSVGELLKADLELAAEMFEQSTSGMRITDLNELIKLLEGYNGRLIIDDGSFSWQLLIERGFVKAAQTFRGPSLRGDEALKALLNNLGHVLKTGGYQLSNLEWRYSEEEAVSQKDVLLRGLELVKEKYDFETQRY